MTTVDQYLAEMNLFSDLGTPGREAFIILTGRASVRRGGRLVATVGSGDILGEMSVLSGLNRSATVTADTDMEAEVLNRREFSSLLDSTPALAKKITVSVIRRLHELEPSLIG